MRAGLAIVGSAVLVVAGCGAPSTHLATSPTTEPSPPLASPATPTASATVSDLERARAAWERRRPSSYAYTYVHRGPGGTGWDSRYRVTVLGGRAQSQLLDGMDFGDGFLDEMTIDGLFARAERLADAGGDFRVSYDADSGFPRAMSRDDRAVADDEFDDTVVDFVTSPDREAAATRTRQLLEQAEAAWRLWAPTDYSYTWRRFAAGPEPAARTTWRVNHAAGATTVESGLVIGDAVPSGQASVASTFAEIRAAVDAGAWVDLTVDPTAGLPLLAAIDPSETVTGDEYWIRLNYRDGQREQATTALAIARERWQNAGLRTYAYTWRFTGEGGTLLYHLAYRGNDSSIRRGPGTPVAEATWASPNIEGTFMTIQEVLAEGGIVQATYDPEDGHPTIVVLRPYGSTAARGTIRITGFTTNP